VFAHVGARNLGVWSKLIGRYVSKHIQVSFKLLLSLGQGHRAMVEKCEGAPISYSRLVIEDGIN